MVRCRRCGHPKDAHEHYRRGTDCALCECRKFSASPLSWVRQVWHTDGPPPGGLSSGDPAPDASHVDASHVDGPHPDGSVAHGRGTLVAGRI
jgi:hypothetical protein